MCSCVLLATFTGPPLAPPPPTYLTLGPSVALLLSEPPFSHLPITGYTILYYSMDSPGTVTNITVSPGTVEVILTGIRPNQNYNVTIYASNAAGISEGTSIPIPSRVIIGECVCVCVSALVTYVYHTQESCISDAHLNVVIYVYVYIYHGRDVRV